MCFTQVIVVASSLDKMPNYHKFVSGGAHMKKNKCCVFMQEWIFDYIQRIFSFVASKSWLHQETKHSV